MNGLLRMYIRGRWVSLNEAVAYQLNGNNNEVPVNWVPNYVNSNGSDLVTFHFESYNPALPLVLRIGAPPMPPAPPPADPRNLTWSTFTGGNQGDELMAVDNDNNEDIYTCGYTTDINFPIGTGFQEFPPFQPNFMGTHESVVMKFNHDTKRIAWATYLGGSEGTMDYDDVGIDQAKDIAVYKGTNATLNYVFVTGTTGCNDFPTAQEGNSPFANAVHEPWSNSSPFLDAAYLGAFTQDNGHYHWGTTLGAGPTGFWEAQGMGVDVDAAGRVAWVGRLDQVSPVDFDFNHVTPNGAFTKSHGGGFFAWFNPQYQYEWKTPFGSQCAACAVNDVKLLSQGNNSSAYLVGTAAASVFDFSYTLDTYAPNGFTGYFQSDAGGGNSDAYFAELDLQTYQNVYCTRWAGNAADHGTAITGFGKDILVVGSTKSTDLNIGQLPGSMGMHDNTLSGPSDGFLLDFALIAGIPNLKYGTLVGSNGREELFDVVLDRACVGQSDCDFYMTGESTSTADLLGPGNPVLYQQSVLGNDGDPGSRDGFFMRSNTGTFEKSWSSYYRRRLNR